MSYEGYTQTLCINGHYKEIDCNDNIEKYCKKCKKELVWFNSVDLTNGSYNQKGKRIDGYINLKVSKRIVCKHCKTALDIIYKIPKKETMIWK